MLLALLQGMIVGLAIAAPVGPVGLLCIRRALADGHFAAFVAGLGAAVADTIFGAVGALGVTLVSDFLLEYRVVLRIVGGLFLVVLGVKTFLAKPVMTPTPKTHFGYMKDFLSTFALTITNPATIAGAMGIFAALGATGFTQEGGAAYMVVVGVFIGSAGWWFMLGAAAGAVRDKFHPDWLLWMNRVMGAVLVAFGLGVLLSLAF